MNIFSRVFVLRSNNCIISNKTCGERRKCIRIILERVNCLMDRLNLKITNSWCKLYVFPDSPVKLKAVIKIISTGTNAHNV